MNSRQLKIEAIKSRQDSIFVLKQKIKTYNRQISLIENQIKETRDFVDLVNAHIKILIETKVFNVAKQFNKVVKKHKKEIQNFEEVRATLILARRPFGELCISLRDAIKSINIEIADIDAIESKLKGDV